MKATTKGKQQRDQENKELEQGSSGGKSKADKWETCAFHGKASKLTGEQHLEDNSQNEMICPSWQAHDTVWWTSSKVSGAWYQQYTTVLCFHSLLDLQKFANYWRLFTWSATKVITAWPRQGELTEASKYSLNAGNCWKYPWKNPWNFNC